METRKRVTGIACDTNVARITIRSVPDSPGIAGSLFEPLSDAGISVDTIVQNSGIEKIADMSFTVTRPDLKRALEIVKASLGNVQGGEISSDANLAKISIVGSGMQNTPGYASRMFRSLARVGVNIEMITTSEIRITCIISEDQVRAAVKALHDDFELEREE